ncbi:Arc family DNA-binding protein [Pseudomonas aeruginosa]|uniref:Arc family DNA-binding protein n=1 Tax=Pseudomonas aeruginosa TaxID=287 RepID=UPI0009A44616|nr:Arc family DNA-binding protein [Pseudomonas aeruginosa]
MSREDPQFKLRMPVALRDQAEQSARASGRSLNAELVARLEASYLGGDTSTSLIPASRARELALMARSELPGEVRRRAIESISRAVRLGHRETVVGLDDLHLGYGISDEELESLFADVLDEFKQAGYQVKWDDITSLWIEF